MKNLLSTLTSALDDQAIGTLSEQISASPAQTRGAVSAALPLLMGMLANNCQSRQGCESLASAVEKDHDGGILSQVQGFLAQGNVSPGEGILKNVFGARQNAAEQQLASQTYLQPNQIHTLLGLLAPLVLGALGKQAQASGGASSSNISALLKGSIGTLMQGQGAQIGTQVLGSLLGGGKNTGGNDSLAQAGSKLLGGLFKK